LLDFFVKGDCQIKELSKETGTVDISDLSSVGGILTGVSLTSSGANDR
jgi:hypothetical protein